jgi:hypothetical protein
MDATVEQLRAGMTACQAALLERSHARAQRMCDAAVGSAIALLTHDRAPGWAGTLTD